MASELEILGKVEQMPKAFEGKRMNMFLAPKTQKINLKASMLCLYKIKC